MLKRLWQRGAAVACAISLCGPAVAGAPVVEDASRLHARIADERRRSAAPLLDRAMFVSHTAVSSVTLSPDSRSVAYLREVRGTRGVWVKSAADGGARRVLARTDAVAIAWSSDGR